MTTISGLAGFLLIVAINQNAAAPPKPLLPIPSPEQLAWQQLEYGMFCHFGINTFHNEEWTDGTKNPRSFNPTEFNGRQWVEVAKRCGMGYLVVTAKHHDGFAVYPTAHSKYAVTASPWRDGKGDAVREVADACHDLGVMFGFYLSPWDRHEPMYANPPAYDTYFKDMLRELLTNYGAVGEVWFDGAGSEGHIYDWDGYYALIRELQPQALIAICGPDIRWVGNEQGVAPETLWNVVDRDDGQVWYPAECDVPIRKGQWFFHTDGEPQLRSVDEVLDIYYKSVGRGAVLLLNVSPDRRGLLPEKDVAVLDEVWRIVTETFKTNLAERKAVTPSNERGGDPAFAAANAVDGDDATYWCTDDGVSEGMLIVDLGQPTTFNRSLIQEHIALGQRVESYKIEALVEDDWIPVVEGTTVGHKRLDRFADVTATQVRMTVRARACPTIQTFGLYRAAE